MSAYHIKPMACPFCQFPMEADYVDVGIGMVQCGPYCCDNCRASECGPEYNGSKESADALDLDAEERKFGFYKNKISPHANQHEGKVISHKQADAIYRANYFDLHGNPYNAPIIR